MMFRILIVLLAAMTIAGVLNACQSLPLRPPGAELEDRVAGLMQAKIDEDWGKFYDYLDPAYKTEVSLQSFLNRPRDAKYTDFVIDTIEINPSGAAADVLVRYDMNFRSYHFTDQRDSQQWVKKDGTWYLKINDENAMGVNPGPMKLKRGAD